MRIFIKVVRKCTFPHTKSWEYMTHITMLFVDDIRLYSYLVEEKDKAVDENV